MSRIALCLVLALLPACVTPVRTLDPARLGKIDAAVDQAIDEHRLPGAVAGLNMAPAITGKLTAIAPSSPPGKP